MQLLNEISQNSQTLADAVNQLTKQIDLSRTSDPSETRNVHFLANSTRFPEGKKMEDNTLDFNFWPSFSDLMLTLVLILVIVVFAVIAAFSIGTDDLRTELKKTKAEMAKVEKEEKVIAEAIAKVEEKQEALIKAIAAAYDVQWEDIDKWEDKESKTNFFEIPIYLENGDYTKIQIQNERHSNVIVLVTVFCLSRIDMI